MGRGSIGNRVKGERVMTRIGCMRVGLAGFMAAAAIAVSDGGVQAQESGLVGTWEATAETPGMPGAPPKPLTWTFEMAEDGTYTGSWTINAAGQSRTGEMSDVSVDGDAFGFTVRIEEQGQAAAMAFEGTVAGDEISGTFGAGPEGMPAMITGTFSGARAEGDGTWRQQAAEGEKRATGLEPATFSLGS